MIKHHRVNGLLLKFRFIGYGMLLKKSLC